MSFVLTPVTLFILGRTSLRNKITELHEWTWEEQVAYHGDTETNEDVGVAAIPRFSVNQARERIGTNQKGLHGSE